MAKLNIAIVKVETIELDVHPTKAKDTLGQMLDERIGKCIENNERLMGFEVELTEQDWIDINAHNAPDPAEEAWAESTDMRGLPRRKPSKKAQ